jgi:transposase
MVELVRAGRSASDLAREFGCNASSIHAWVKAASGLDGSGANNLDTPLSTNERQELIELRCKFRQVQQERDILAKATGWFAAKSEKTPTSSTSAFRGAAAGCGDDVARGEDGLIAKQRPHFRAITTHLSQAEAPQPTTNYLAQVFN